MARSLEIKVPARKRLETKLDGTQGRPVVRVCPASHGPLILILIVSHDSHNTNEKRALIALSLIMALVAIQASTDVHPR
jgi:hypothetical protein